MKRKVKNKSKSNAKSKTRNDTIIKNKNSIQFDIKSSTRKSSVLFILLAFTWLLGTCNYCFSYTSYEYINHCDFDIQSAISLYPQAVHLIGGYEHHNNIFHATDNDPRIYFVPPNQEITSTLIRLAQPTKNDFNVQVYYADNPGGYESEPYSIITYYRKGTQEMVLNFPLGIYTILRYDINIFDEEFEINDIYVSDKTPKVTITRQWRGNTDGLLMVIIIDVFLLMIWNIAIKKRYPDSVREYCQRLYLAIIQKHRKIIKNAFLFSAIIVAAIIIESANMLFITKGNTLNHYRVLLYTAGGMVCFFIALLYRSPEKLFLSISLTIGLLFIVVLPPVAIVTWDEQIHYIKSVEHSFVRSVVISEFDNKVSTPSAVPAVYDKESRKTLVLDMNSIEYAQINTVHSKENTHFYNNVGYFPAGIMIFIGRSLSLSNSMIFILGRLGNLLAYSLLVYIAIKKLHSGKYIMAAIALFPTAVFQSVTYTYDFWVTAWVMLGFSYYVYEIQNPEIKTETKNLILMVGSFILGLGPKAPYFPMLFPLYFIGSKKFDSAKAHKKYILWLSIAILFIIGSFMVPLIFSRGEAYTDFRGGSDVSASGQIAFILKNPITYTKTLLAFIIKYVSIDKVSGYTTFFAYLGSIPHCYVVWIILLYAVFTDKTELDQFTSSSKYRLIIWVSVFLTISLLATSLYIAFTPVGLDTINGVQSRYLLPILFPFFSILGSSKLVNKTSRKSFSVVIFSVLSFILLNGIWEICISKY